MTSAFSVFVWRCQELGCGFELPVDDSKLKEKWRAHQALHQTGARVVELEVPAKIEEDHPQ